MEKVPNYKRIIEVLRRGGQPTNNERVWINYYLELADKYLGLSDHTPAEKVPPDKRNDEKPANQVRTAAGWGNAESTDAESAEVDPSLPKLKNNQPEES